MSQHADATYVMTGWDETPFDSADGAPKTTQVLVTKTYEGDIEGEGTLRYLMVYADDDSAEFVGLERITGSISGRSGAFALEHRGRFEGGKASSTWTVVPGSGAGELAGLRGSGSSSVGHLERYPMPLEYELP